ELPLTQNAVIRCAIAAGFQERAWARTEKWGMHDTDGNAAFYLETNQINYFAQATDVGSGCMFVVRYNTFKNAAVASHGTGESQKMGARWGEVYANTFVCTTPFQSLSSWVYGRGGTWLVHHNTFPSGTDCGTPRPFGYGVWALVSGGAGCYAGPWPYYQ